jgi:hypothetical protein
VPSLIKKFARQANSSSKNVCFSSLLAGETRRALIKLGTLLDSVGEDHLYDIGEPQACEKAFKQGLD